RGDAHVARDRGPLLVGGIGPELDPRHVAELEADSRERRRRLGGEALTHAARADPVADLQLALAAARVQGGAADRLRLVGREDPVDEVLAEVEAAAEPAQQLYLRLPRAGGLRRP